MTLAERASAIGRSFAAVSAIELEAQNLRLAVSQRIEEPQMAAWLDFWVRLVEYRNRAEAHPAAYNWPVNNPDYFSVIVPLLESAIVEALTAPDITRVLDKNPLATPGQVKYEGGKYEHEVYREDLGLPFESVISPDRSVTDIWSHPGWKATRGCELMLEKLPSGAYALTGIMHDLMRAGAPAPLTAVATAASAHGGSTAFGAALNDLPGHSGGTE